MVSRVWEAGAGAGAEAADSGDFGFEEHPPRASKTITSGAANVFALNVNARILGDTLPPLEVVGLWSKFFFRLKNGNYFHFTLVCLSLGCLNQARLAATRTGLRAAYPEQPQNPGPIICRDR